jgi:hypothetical protein
MSRFAVTVTIVALVLSTSAFGAYLFFDAHLKSADEYPVITLKNDVLSLSVTSTEKDFLENVKAHDAEDGDITKNVIVESISPFDENGVRTVTYVACDSANHVVKKTCSLHYTDYTPPTIKQTQPLRFQKGGKTDGILKAFTATDVIDGDLTGKIKIESMPSTDEEGVFPAFISVTNSAGDTSTVTVMYEVLSEPKKAPTVYLTDYITYTKNESFDPMSYVDRVSSSVIKTIDGRLTEETIDISDVYWECDTDITTAVPGSYIVTFWTENSAGIIGYTYMTVIKK